MKTENNKAAAEACFSSLGLGGVFDSYSDKLEYDAAYGYYYQIIKIILADGIGQGFDSNEDCEKFRVSLSVFYINNINFNAVATKYNDRYYIGINSGTVYLLERLFHEMLSSTEILPLFGDVNMENKHHKIKGELYSTVDNFSNPNSVQYDLPVNAGRGIIAMNLTAIALGLITLHELTHIMDGHIDYLNDKMSISIIKEYYANEEQKLDYELSQILEYDADLIGIGKLVRLAIFCRQYPEILPKEFLFLCNNTSMFIGFIAFAVYCAFRLFSHDSALVVNMQERYYPTFEFRRKQVVPMIATLIIDEVDKGRLDKKDADEIIALSCEFLFWAEQSFEDSYLHPLGDSLIDTGGILLSSSEMTHSGWLKSKWKKYGSILAKYAYGKLSTFE